MERVTPLSRCRAWPTSTDDELARAYAPLAEPWLRVNFVSTVDGAAQGGDGLSGSINNAADKRVFDALRRRADCLVVGAGTLRDEGYAVPKMPLVVVSRSGEVPANLREAPEGRILMATTASADGLPTSRVAAGRRAGAGAGRRRGRPRRAQVRLAGRGWVDQLCEGGPSLFAAALRGRRGRRAVPDHRAAVLGGDHTRIAAGADLDVELRPHSLLEQDGTLLGRWLVASGSS